MAVSHLEVTRRTPFAYDYERIDGWLHFSVDPAHPANRRIADLELAARDADGRVSFAADFLLLQPRDAGRGNRRLLYYVVNRGQRVGVPFNRYTPQPATVPPSDEIDVGDGFLMRRGWSVAMCGWQWDVERRPGLLGLDAPQALGPDGAPLRGRVAVAFQPNEHHPHQLLAHWPLHPAPGRQAIAHQPYPAADVNEQTAEMTVRDAKDAPRMLIPRERWRFARPEHGELVPDDRYVWLDGGFEAGRWYEVIYTTRSCPVVGTGLLATRDCVAWLRHAPTPDNPAAGRLDFTYGTGRSQCGRFLRHFVYEGLNVDEDGRQVFDGLMPHVAGARRGEFNERYGQPSETRSSGSGGTPPFTPGELFARARELGGVPRVFETNTSSEYWRSDCSLIHTDPNGERDVEPPPEERIYLIAGHQHGPGMAVVSDTTPIGARGANLFNVVDGSLAERALLTRLDAWVAEGIEPPASTFPRLADRTAVDREWLLAQFRGLPGVALLDSTRLPRLRRPDGEAYPSYAAALDADGNEVVGIRVPDVQVPIGTHTGWVPRHPATGGAGQLLDMMGSSLPFAANEAERARSSDPRPSLAERYRDREDYLAQVRAAAQRLVADGFLLEEDIEVAVDLAARRYELVQSAISSQPSAVSS